MTTLATLQMDSDSMPEPQKGREVRKAVFPLKKPLGKRLETSLEACLRLGLMFSGKLPAGSPVLAFSVCRPFPFFVERFFETPMAASSSTAMGGTDMSSDFSRTGMCKLPICEAVPPHPQLPERWHPPYRQAAIRGKRGHDSQLNPPSLQLPRSSSNRDVSTVSTLFVWGRAMRPPEDAVVAHAEVYELN